MTYDEWRADELKRFWWDALSHLMRSATKDSRWRMSHKMLWMLCEILDQRRYLAHGVYNDEAELLGIAIAFDDTADTVLLAS